MHLCIELACKSRFRASLVGWSIWQLNFPDSCGQTGAPFAGQTGGSGWVAGTAAIGVGGLMALPFSPLICDCSQEAVE
jgi:hypothetical protein